jgi:hypothetical protein
MRSRCQWGGVVRGRSLSAKTFQHLGLITRPFEPAIYYEIGAFCARDREPSILAQSFLSKLVEKLGPLYA